MAAPVLRIFSYLPNPRVWKALIAAELCGVEVEVSGDESGNLAGWLWDYDARPLPERERAEASPHARMGRRGFRGTLYKTDAFMAAHPFGTVPAAFSPGGRIGIFESNSILRAVARAGDRPLYGRDDYEASRIDSFLDANLVFAREAQVYLLGMSAPAAAVHERMRAAYEFYLGGVENALTQGDYLTGDALTIADISFVCDFAQELREVADERDEALTDSGLALVSRDGPDDYPRAFAHMLRLDRTEAFAKHMGTYLNWYRRKRAAQT